MYTVTDYQPNTNTNHDEAKVVASYESVRQARKEHPSSLVYIGEAPVGAVIGETGLMPIFMDDLADAMASEAPTVVGTVTVDLAKFHTLFRAVDHAWNAWGTDRPGISTRIQIPLVSPYRWRDVEDRPAEIVLSLISHSQALTHVALATWSAVKTPTRSDINTDRSDLRFMVRTAIAVARAKQYLHEIGIRPDPLDEMCGTGRNFGLQGLALRAGHTTIDHDEREYTHAELEAYADGTAFPRRP